MTLSTGSRLGPYEILSPLGAGGMGEVYKARDTRLDRHVAVKVLPESLSGDAMALARFEREAKAVAALSHPNILGIYELGRDGATTYAAMELLHGESLRERLDEGRLPRSKALEYGLQIARGLAAAHEKGVVHRDLKPENVFVTSEGRVKILDFGLAKVASQARVGTQSATGVEETEPGTILGTVGYMSPEQVRGRPADARSDIFSLGAVLYEMLTGTRAFRGDSAVETMAAIAQEDPEDLFSEGGRLTPALQRILRHCLEKRAEERFDTANDLAFALESATGVPSASSTGASPIPRRKTWLPAAGALAALVAVLAAGVWLGRSLGSPRPPSFRRLTYHRGFVQSARFAPDGQTVVYGSTLHADPLRIFSTRLDAIESRALDFPPADIAGMAANGEMAILLGRRHAGYWISRGTLAQANLGGGAPHPILENVNEADISPNGKAFAVVREAGARQILEYPIGRKLFETNGTVSNPRIARDGRRVAFFEHPEYGDDFGYLALADADGKVRRLTQGFDGAQGLAWAPDGEEIWFTAADLVTAASMGSRAALFAVRPGRKPRAVYQPPLELRLHDISPTGAVLMDAILNRTEVGGRLAGDTAERDLSTWSNELVMGISADGTSFGGLEQGAAGAAGDPYIYYRRATDPAPVRIGSGQAGGLSPDGRWVVATKTRTPSRLLLLPTGPGEPRSIDLGRIQTDLIPQRGVSWSADGSQVLILGHEAGRKPRLWIVDLAGSGAARPATPEGTVRGVLSPDGRSIATLDETGRVRRCSAANEECGDIAGVAPGEIPEQWEASGKAILVWDRIWPARIYRVDLETGQRRLWREISPYDPASILYGSLILARDGEHYVYRVRRVASQLFVAEGLK